ncbi:ATP-binding protein [Pseudonocardia pini]|uniref:ATP-binding protein n=1 Tax=Pseudonocardia pini TaxID=2758030 RepID=UPI0015F109DE|nr:ATP-binding protein [Pseudonocardia pini]
MKVESRVPETTRLRHAVQFHDGPADQLERAVAFARDTVRRGERLALAVPAEIEEAVFAAVGHAGVATLASPRGSSGGSGQTTAALRARELRSLVQSDAGVTVLSAHDPALDGVDGGYWTELDAALNVALGDLPVDLVCLFPGFPLHLEVLDGARVNHPYELVDGVLHENPQHRCPREVLRDRDPSAPLVLGPPDLTHRYNSWQLHEVRGMVARLAPALGFDPVRSEDLVLAVNEVATNAVEHGSPQAEIQLWATSGGLVCEVHDVGHLTEPLPGMVAPHPADPRGRGVWIARQLCDLLHVWQDGAGTHVRLHATP